MADELDQGVDDAALYAVEVRARTRVRRHIDPLVGRLGLAVRAAARAAPGASGAELTSRADLHAETAAALDAAAARARLAVAAAYTAGVRLGRAGARNQLARLGHTLSGPAGGSVEARDAFVAAVDAAFVHAGPDLQEGIAEAVDLAQGAGSDPARTLIVHSALRRVTRGLAARVAPAAAAAVHRGYSDAQAEAHQAFRDAQPGVVLVKTWQVRSDNPCPYCAALDGTTIDADAGFDPAAGADDGRAALPLPPSLTAATPPRHAHCRCRVVYHTVELSGQASDSP